MKLAIDQVYFLKAEEFCTLFLRMMNVIYADGDKAGNKIYNGVTIPDKYGVTVEYMTTQSENCQQKFGGFSHDPYVDQCVMIQFHLLWLNKKKITQESLGKLMTNYHLSCQRPLPSDINADCIFNLPVCYPSADKRKSYSPLEKKGNNHCVYNLVTEY
jgi:hypothetical protein